MSKIKEEIANLRSKVFDKKKEEIIEEATQTIAANAMDGVVYDVIQNPAVKNREFLIVKLRYDLASKTATIEEVRPFQDKAAGLSIQMDKQSRAYLFERNKGSKE